VEKEKLSINLTAKKEAMSKIVELQIYRNICGD
jgi:hypothetical protein